MINIEGNVRMTLTEANYYNALEARDKALPAERVDYEFGGESKFYYKCPMCGESVTDNTIFCRKCGQRIDRENEAL